jgi:hypothetical protein
MPTNSPNPTLQRTRSAVTAPASDLRLSPAAQPPRQLRTSLSLPSLGHSAKLSLSMRFLFVALSLILIIRSSYGAPFEFPIEGDPGIVLKLDREYSCIELSAKESEPKRNIRVYMFTPSDEQSSVVFSIGPDAKGETGETIAAQYKGAKITKVAGQINKKKVQWLRWADADHLYSSCDVTLTDKAGTERLVSVWLIANTTRRLSALENSFSTIGFF